MTDMIGNTISHSKIMEQVGQGGPVSPKPSLKREDNL